MRIGFVLDESLDGTDGVQQYVLRVSEWLRSKGNEIYYLVGETTRTDVSNIHSLTKNFHVSFNGNRLSTPLPASRKRLRATLKTLQLDVLHVQVPYSPFLAGRILDVVDDDVAVVGTFHVLPYSRFASFASYGLGLVNVATSRRFDAMLAVSVPAQAFARSHYGLVCTVVPNCFQYDTFKAPAIVSRETTKHIVYLGRLVARKGPMELVQAIARLRKHSQWPEHWQVVLGGKGQLAEPLSRYIRKHRLGDIVSLYGFVPEDAKAAFLERADIAVFPSTAGESFGISLLEALAAARGVVLAGDNPGYRTVMNGFEKQLFKPKETKTFAELLAYWMAHDSKRAALALKQQTYVKQFDTAIVGEQILAVYNKALQSRRPSWHNKA